MHKAPLSGGESVPGFPENINPGTVSEIGKQALAPYNQFPHYFAANATGSNSGETPDQKAKRLGKEIEEIDKEFDRVRRIGKPEDKPSGQ